MLSDGGIPGYRLGLISQVQALTQKGDANALGDLVALFGGHVKTFRQADAMPGPTEFYDRFLGVLTNGAATGQEPADTPCTVFTQGQVLYPLDVPAAQAWPVGTYVKAADDARVAVDPTANLSTMVGKVCVPVSAGATEVYFELRSRVMS